MLLMKYSNCVDIFYTHANIDTYMYNVYIYILYTHTDSLIQHLFINPGYNTIIS